MMIKLVRALNTRCFPALLASVFGLPWSGVGASLGSTLVISRSDNVLICLLDIHRLFCTRATQWYN